jgi:hypothetical protein
MTTVSLQKIAHDNYIYFKQLEGSNHIATFSSQLNLLETIKNYEIKKALDWGAGIGTISNLLSKNKDCQVIAYELNSWCRNQFTRNLVGKNSITLTNELPLDSDFDLIVIDDDITRRQISKLLRSRRLKVVFVEGWRNKTVGNLSFGLLLKGKSSQFKRCASRLLEFDLQGKNGTRVEKSGSYFIISAEKNSFPLALISWINRLNKTNEFEEFLKEIYYWIARTLAVRSRIDKLRKS